MSGETVIYDADGLRVVSDGGRYLAVGDGDPLPLYTVPGKVPPRPTPVWIGDLGSFGWDSAVAFVRHAERPAHFLASRMGIGGTDLTRRGFVDSVDAGRRLRGYRITGALTSPVPRCVSTARGLVQGYGRYVAVEQREEIGGYGTAFMHSADYAEEDFREPGTVAAVAHLAGRPLKGWYSPKKCAQNILAMLSPYLEGEGLALCVNHDLFVSTILGALSGRFPRDQWIPYLGGGLICRKGRDLFLVVNGKRYDFGEPHETADVSPISVPREVPLSGKGQEVPPLKVIDRNDVMWCGASHEGIRLCLDPQGRFFYLRDDGYPVRTESWDWAGDFSGHTAPVARNGVGATHITDFGDYLHNRWFLEARGYRDGVAAVRDGRGWFHIDMRGEPMYDERFDSVSDCHRGTVICRSAEGTLRRDLNTDNGWM